MNSGMNTVKCLLLFLFLEYKYRRAAVPGHKAEHNLYQMWSRRQQHPPTCIVVVVVVVGLMQADAQRSQMETLQWRTVIIIIVMMMFMTIMMMVMINKTT